MPAKQTLTSVVICDFCGRRLDISTDDIHNFDIKKAAIEKGFTVFETNKMWFFCFSCFSTYDNIKSALNNKAIKENPTIDTSSNSELQLPYHETISFVVSENNEDPDIGGFFAYDSNDWDSVVEKDNAWRGFGFTPLEAIDNLLDILGSQDSSNYPQLWYFNHE